MENLFAQVQQCILSKEVDEKTQLVFSVVAKWQRGELSMQNCELADILEPGRPNSLNYVNPQQVARRKVSTDEGRAALMHAIAHIEFTAIDLALDAVFRFRDCPQQYYDDWMQIAKEETEHFTMINEYLQHMGIAYGDFSVHGRLWEVAMETKNDVMYRMALVPRVFEARGLDATPAIVKKFAKIGDAAALAILAKIEAEEIGHVQVGSKWFEYFCHQRGLDSEQTFKRLLSENHNIYIKRPLAYEARKKAGFSEAEINFLDSIAK